MLEGSPVITRNSPAGKLVHRLLVLWPDWRSYFDDSDPSREPQVVFEGLTEEELGIL